MTSLPPEPPDDQHPDTSPPPPDPDPAPTPAYGQAPPPYAQPSYGSAPPPSPAGAPGARPGELLDRFLARLIDHVLLALVNTVVISVIVVGAVLGESANSFGSSSTFLAGAVASVLTTVLALAYFGYLESSRGQTVGKMIMKLRTVGPDGANPTMEQALRRNIYVAAGLLGIIPVIGWIGSLASLVGMILIAVNINNDTVHRQGWHDHFAGETRVLKIG